MACVGWISVMLSLECLTWHKDIWFQTCLHFFAICLGVVDCAQFMFLYEFFNWLDLWNIKKNLSAMSLPISTQYLLDEEQ